jgi:hypothetical protein
MGRITGLMAGLLMATVASNAFAQVDCTVPGGCTATKYGFGTKPEYRKDDVPPNQFRYTDAFFGPNLGGVSYFVSKSDLTGRIGNCGPRRNHSPLPGQVILREQTNCVPTSQGPSCTAGTNVGATCHLPTLNETCTGAGAPYACCTGAGTGRCLGNEVCTAAGAPQACCTGAGTGTCPPFATSASNTLECGTGGTCTMDPGLGCRVEIPLSDGGVTPVADTSEVLIFTIVFNVPAPNGDTYSLSAQTGNTIGGTSDDSNPLCIDANVRRRPTTGTRYLLPPGRGPAGGTYVRWDSGAGIVADDRDDFNTSFRVHTDDSAVCCAAGNPTLGTCSVVVPPFTPNYPLLTQRNCGQPGRYVNEDNLTNDWLFSGGLGTAFYTDPDYVVPGQIPGLCRVNSSVSCYRAGANAACTGLGTPFACCTGNTTGTCTQDCTGLDADPGTPGIQPDTCDFTTPGHRVQVTCARDANNNVRTDCCGTANYVLRGTPNSGCGVNPRFPYNGDPGSDCGVGNYGIDHRDDANCNGVDDRVDAGTTDYCPFYSEWDQDLDSDPDCDDGGGGNCRGDECECGDQAGSGVLSGTVELGNGIVNVSDLVGINSAIFGSVVRKRLCDANSDTLCNVSDIIGTNKEIFVPDSSVCRQITPRQCLTGVDGPCCGNGFIDQGEVCDDGSTACVGGPTPGAACERHVDCGTVGVCVGGTNPGAACTAPATCGAGGNCQLPVCQGETPVSGDGCNLACRVEFGFTCTGEPSVCS